MTADPGILSDLPEIRCDPVLERGLQPPMPYSPCQRKPLRCLMMVSIGSYCFEDETDIINMQCRGNRKSISKKEKMK